MTDHLRAPKSDNSGGQGHPVRRRRLLAAVAGAAIAGGAALSWWRFSSGQIDSRTIGHLWEMRFDTPDGEPLVMRSFAGKPLLLNFWATWCPPCIEELPMLDAFYSERMAQDWQVVGLAIDQPSAVRRFMQRTPVSFPIGLAGQEGAHLTKLLGNESGGLPFTVVFGPDGQVRARKLGQLSAADLQSWAKRREPR